MGYHINQFTKFATLSGQRKSRAVSMFSWVFPPPLFKRERALSRFPSIFRKHIQRFIPFLGWFFPPWRSKLNSHCLPQSQPAAQGLGIPHTSAPQTPARGVAVPRGQEPLALTTRRDAGAEGRSPYPAPQILNPTLAREARNRLGES